MPNLRPNTAVGSKKFEGIRTILEGGRYVERIVARCSIPSCRRSIEKSAPWHWALHNAHLWLEKEGWETEPRILCPLCVLKQQQDKEAKKTTPVAILGGTPGNFATIGEIMSTKDNMVSSTAIMSGAPPVKVPRVFTAPPIQPTVNPAASNSGFDLDLKISITGQKDKRLNYVFRFCREVAKSLTPNMHYANFDYHDGRLIIYFATTGAKVSKQNGYFDIVKPINSQALFPPNTRMTRVELPAHFDGRRIVLKDPLPMNLRPVLAPSVPLGRKRKIVQPVEQVASEAATVEAVPEVAAEVIAAVEVPVSPSILATPLPSDTSVELDAIRNADQKAFSDDDVRTLIAMIKDCQLKRTDVIFAIENGKIMAKKLRIVEEEM